MIINGKQYVFYVRRAYTPIDVYKSQDSFLRIGPAKLISKEVATHKQLSNLGFPVAPLLGEGTYEDQAYFIEKSLGDKHYGDIFATDTTLHGSISDEHFTAWLKLVKAYEKVQMKTAKKNQDWEGFEKTIHYADILTELPDMKNSIIQAIEKIKNTLSSSTFVMSHNDFNSHNIFPKGIIDLDRASYSPVGYDLITNIFQIFLHPCLPADRAKNDNFEFSRKYEFSKKQIESYFAAF